MRSEALAGNPMKGVYAMPSLTSTYDTSTVESEIAGFVIRPEDAPLARCLIHNGCQAPGDLACPVQCPPPVRYMGPHSKGSLLVHGDTSRPANPAAARLTGVCCRLGGNRTCQIRVGRGKTEEPETRLLELLAIFLQQVQDPQDECVLLGGLESIQRWCASAG